jgi:hypothetical protein
MSDGTLEQEPVNKGGRPRKVSFNDDTGLLDLMLRIQIKIAEDTKSNAATRQRAADSVAELIKHRASRRDDEAKATLSAEVTALTARIAELRQSAAGKVDASEVTGLRQELTRLRSESQAHGPRLTAVEAERNAALTAFRYTSETLGPEGCHRAAMKALCDGSATKALLEMFGVDARAWLQMNTDHNTKSALLDVFKKRTADRGTPLTEFCRLRLQVEHGIDGVEQFLKDEEQRRLQGEAQRIVDHAFLNAEARMPRRY